jgi:hypothetical protein
MVKSVNTDEIIADYSLTYQATNHYQPISYDDTREILRDIFDDAVDFARSNETGWFYPDDKE